MMTALDKITAGTFAEACYNQNSIEELQNCKTADKTDMREWKLTKNEWCKNIKLALAAKLEDLQE